MKLVLIGAGESPHLLKWARALAAAPGVDQVIRMGARAHSDRPSVARPMPRPRASTQDVTWAGVAPRDWAA